MTLLSVIVPTCHRNEELGKCLVRVAPRQQEGVACYQPTSPRAKGEGSTGYEVIVTDDGRLSTAEEMMRAFPWAKWVCGPKRGPAANRNCGAKEATGDWLVFVDDDCLPEKTLLAAYARAIVADDADVLEGMTLSQGSREAADMDCPINESGGRLWSCNFAIKRRVFLELGGFDESFTMALEDIDMQTRLSKGGHKTTFVSDARVNHPWHSRKDIKFLLSAAQDMAYYIQKHPESRKWWSPGCLLKRAGRALLLEFPSNLIRFRGRGVLRQLFLEFILVTLHVRYWLTGVKFSQAGSRPSISDKVEGPFG
jgi:GT2 family glycosyltransferase